MNKVQIARGVFMHPVYDIPVDAVCEVTRERQDIVDAVLLPEVQSWLTERGLDPSEHHGSHNWSYYFLIEEQTATFMFADPQIAMLFKLRYQGVF